MALTFNGSTQYCTGASAMVAGPPFTMGAWINYTSFTDFPTVATSVSITQGNSNFYGYDMYITPAGAAVAFTGNGASSANATTAVTIGTGTWHYITAVFTSSTSRTVYIDGANPVTNSTSIVNPPIDHFYVAVESAGNGTLSAFATGQIAFLAIWNIALAAGDILTLAKGTQPPYVQQPSLAHYWIWQDGSPGNDGIAGGSNLSLIAAPTVSVGPPTYGPIIFSDGMTVGRMVLNE